VITNDEAMLDVVEDALVRLGGRRRLKALSLVVAERQQVHLLEKRISAERKRETESVNKM